MSPENGEISKEEKIAARKAKQEEILAKVAERAKKTRKLIILGVSAVVIIIIAAVVLSFVLIDVIGTKTDWKAGDTFTFDESWAKVRPPALSSGLGAIDPEYTSTIKGTCKVLEVKGGLPVKLEINLESFKLRGVQAAEPVVITATRKDAGSEWACDPALHEDCPLRVDFLLTCGVDIPAQKWRHLQQVILPPPRWVTPKYPVKCIPDKINYTFTAENIGFDMYVNTRGKEKEKPKTTVDGKVYPVGVRVKKDFRYDVKRNFIIYFDFQVYPDVMGHEYPQRERRDIPPPGFNSCGVKVSREWKVEEKKKEPKSKEQD